MYTKAAVLATSATSLPMWGPEGYRMVPLPNMVADFRDTPPLLAPGFAQVSLSLNLCSNWPQAAHDMPSLAQSSTSGVPNRPLIFVCVHGTQAELQPHVASTT